MAALLAILFTAVAAALLASFLLSRRRTARTQNDHEPSAAAALRHRTHTSRRIESRLKVISSDGRSMPPAASNPASSRQPAHAPATDEDNPSLAADLPSDSDSSWKGKGDEPDSRIRDPVCDIADADADGARHPEASDSAPHDVSPPPRASDAADPFDDRRIKTLDAAIVQPVQNPTDQPPTTSAAREATEPPADHSVADDAVSAAVPPNTQPTSAAADDGDDESTAARTLPEELLPQPEPEAVPDQRPRHPAVHRDRRGRRRTLPAAPAAPEDTQTEPPAAIRPPAEARLRLSLHPIRRAATLSVVLTRPDGFPQRVTVVRADGDESVEAFDMQRYDDLDLPWDNSLLDGELRLDSTQGFQWLRSARQVHIFAADPSEPELISVGAARLGATHTLICRSADEDAVRAAAASAGSPDLQPHAHWQGIPSRWAVLSGYVPAHAASPPLPPGLRPLDPGEGLEIGLEGGLELRPRVYASGHPPRIVIRPAPGAAAVMIGGEPAMVSGDGSWTAAGWDAPGQHIVDIVPGPSLSYEIAADPWLVGEWEFWNAHPERFGATASGPWARAEVCGAQIRGSAGETVLAAETQATLIALGAKWGATPLRRRDDVSVSVAFADEPPAFLIAASGQRRSQGRVLWLGLASAPRPSRRSDAEWASAVRMAASRRLPLERADALGENAWRKAKERARRLWRRRA